jgi:hypothetical protein
LPSAIPANKYIYPIKETIKNNKKQKILKILKILKKDVK